jgi:hypothetical protein
VEHRNGLALLLIDKYRQEVGATEFWLATDLAPDALTAAPGA